MTSRRARHAALAAAALAVAIGGVESARAATSRLEGGGDALRIAVAAARAGDVIEVGPGTWDGPLRIDVPIVLRGRGGVLDGKGVGSPLVLAAPGARVEGLRVRASGEDLGRSDACIYVEPSATGASISGCELRDCAFGIWVHEADGVQIVDNDIEGRAERRESDRGNGIHLFDGRNLLVRDNRVAHARDGIYVSATEDSAIESNRADSVRFGIHYMYSYRNRVIDNEMRSSKVGIALMESRDLTVTGNRAIDNEREGLLFRDVQTSSIRANVLERNGTGMFFYSSTENVIEDNQVVANDIGLKVWAGSVRNRVEGNAIRGNREQVFYVASEDQVWGDSGRGNAWGDYLGWDQDGDGVGDRPHRVDSFTANLLHRYPSAALLLRSPALELLARVFDQMPLLRAPTIVDVAPLVAGSGR